MSGRPPAGRPGLADRRRAGRGAGLGVGEERVVGAGVGRAVAEAADRLDPGGHEHVALAGLDGVGRHADGLERRGAVAVDGDAGHVVEPGQEGRPPGPGCSRPRRRAGRSPRIRSSTVCGSSWGTLARTALTTRAARSSGRQSTSEPLLARPMGVRPVATMTASGMAAPRFGDRSGDFGRSPVDDLLASAGYMGGSPGVGTATGRLTVADVGAAMAGPRGAGRGL